VLAESISAGQRVLGYELHDVVCVRLLGHACMYCDVTLSMKVDMRGHIRSLHEGNDCI